jgi:hypothetical protein
MKRADLTRLHASSVLAVAIAIGFLLPSIAQARTTHSSSARIAARQVNVTFKGDVSAAAQQSVFARAGLVRLHTTSNPLSFVGRAVSAQAARRALAALRREPQVSYAGRDHVAQAMLTPNDLYFPTISWTWTNANFPAAWNLTSGSASVIVAVVDTGVQANNPDLQGSVLPGYNFVAGNTDTTDDFGHGTEVAGTIAAHGNNVIGVAGACWSCQILPVKVLDSTGHGTDSNIESGIRWAADHGANIINVSIGGTADDPTLRAAVSYAVGRGALVVIAAGNSASTDPGMGPTGGYPAFYASQIAGAISVGALDYNDVLYDFSDYGAWVEVAAAGCDMSTTNSGGYTVGGVCGTSFASPQVAGLAALLLSVTPDLTPAQIETKIEASANTQRPNLRSQTLSCGGPCTAFGRIDAQALFVPANTSLPTLAGTADVGQTLTASPGTWSGAGVSTANVWQRSNDSGATWTTIALATGTTYTLATADVGATVRVSVSGSNAVGATTASSAATPVVAGSAATITNVKLSGIAQEGELLRVSATIGGTNPARTYTWARFSGVWTTIAGAVWQSYTPTAADVGLTLKATMSVSNDSGSGSGSAVSDVVQAAPVVVPPVVPPAPPVSGGQPDLTLEITTDAPPTLNGNVTYRLKVWAKIGNGATGEATSTFTLPDQVQVTSVYVGHGPGCTQAGQVLACNLDWVNPGEPVTVIVQGTVTKPGTLTATATVWAMGELNTTDNHATLAQNVADPSAPPPPTTPKETQGVTSRGSTPALYSSRRYKQLTPGATLSLAANVARSLAAEGLPGATVRYQWQAAGTSHRFTNLSTQTRASLKLTASLVGKQVRVLLSVRSATGMMTVTSQASAAIRSH